jgi:hypothetical protein
VGKINIKVNTTGYGGRKLEKTAVIHSNDPINRNVTLTIYGDIEKFARVDPDRLRLYGQLGEKIEGKVIITPEKDFAFNIIEATAMKGDNIRFKLEKNNTGKPDGYLLTVENQMDKVGRYFDSIHLKTDSKINPVITVRVYGNIYQKHDEPKTQ